MEKFDVIIVGAGPGGLRCAEVLSKSNKKILLLEKNSKIGQKICAGGLSRKSFKLLNLPPEIIECECKSAIFNTSDSKIRLDFGEVIGCTIDREKLGQWQLEKIKNTGIKILTSAEVSEITKKSVRMKNGEEFEYVYLVGADGSNSLVRKFLKLPIRLMSVAFQYLIPQKFSDIEIFFDSKLFNIWYSWIFPHQNYTSVGSGCFPKIISISEVRKNFEKWAENKKIDLSQAKFEAFPINCDYRGFNFGNIFLIGDAAGLAAMFTGEGIYQALISGEEVANMILSSKYKPRGIRKIRREVFIQNLIAAVIRLSGPLRNQLFNLIIFCMKSRFFGRTLIKTLT